MSGASLAPLARAQALLREGQAAEAIAALEPLLKRSPDNVEAWFALGQARGMLEQHAAAEQAFSKAASLRPDMHEAHFNVALSLAYQEKLLESVESFLAARQLVPDIPGLEQTLLEVLLQILQDDHYADAGIKFQLSPLAEAPLVSVVVPTRDRSAMLRDALASVCAQTYRNWEAIVINDGGEDISDVLQSLAGGAAPRITPIRLEHSRGQAHARNRGIAAARGDIVAFLDDDDLYKSHHLDALVTGLRDSGAAVGYTRAEAVWEQLSDGVRIAIKRGPASPWYRYSRALLLVRNCMPIDNWAVRRECFEACGKFDENLPCAEDWDLLLRLSARVDLHQISEITTEVRVRDDAVDSVSKRNRLRPMCAAFYRQYGANGHELVQLARELYLKSLP
ncbi:MAG: glycosyltransferase [Burkholderiales bacterium]|nr:glycosyltransferase [Burkholderiales bacterium]